LLTLESIGDQVPEGEGVAVAVKFIPVTLALEIVTGCEVGEKEYELKLGVTV